MEEDKAVTLEVQDGRHVPAEFYEIAGDDARVRDGSGLGHRVIDKVKFTQYVGVVEKKTTTESDGYEYTWGRLLTGGWVALSRTRTYFKKVAGR